MKTPALLLALCARPLYAGTTGNTDQIILFYIILGILAVMLSVDALIRYRKRKKAEREQAALETEAADSPESPL